jgi:lactate racemase
MKRSIVYGSGSLVVDLPDDTTVVSPAVGLRLPATDDLETTVRDALERPLDGPPLRDRVRPGHHVTIAFDDPTVPCFAPVWSTALPLMVDELERAGVHRSAIHLVCANALHRKFAPDELARIVGDDFVKDHYERIVCHDAENPDELVHLGTTTSQLDVELNRSVIDSDLTVYLNCATVRGFSGGWKSVCVGLSSYRSIRHHHTPDVMSMSLDRNKMHAMLDEMGALVDSRVGAERIFKLETVLANAFAVHTIVSGSVGATRARVLEILRSAQPARRELVDERADIVVYGVPDWSPYAAFSHGNPILDLISTGLGYLGGMIQAVGKPGCTVVMATPCPDRWDEVHHPSYPEAWERILPATRDPDEARRDFEPDLAGRDDYIEKYRHGFGFHPVHAVMAMYPLKRLRHTARVIVAAPQDDTIPRHCGFDAAPSVEAALADAAAEHGPGAHLVLVDNPPAVNRV